jgi:hypothetical protein
MTIIIIIIIIIIVITINHHHMPLLSRILLLNIIHLTSRLSYAKFCAMAICHSPGVEFAREGW